MTPEDADGTSPREKGIARRPVLRGLGAGALAAGGGGLLAACGSGLSDPRSHASGRDTITIGFITPLTGRLAHFSAGDNFVLTKIRATAPYSRGFRVGGKKFQVKIVTMDSQSSPSRASQAARDLIVNHNVDMLVTTSTPDTANPVAVIGETEGVPCLSTVVPWESWYAGLGGNPDAPTQVFQYCTMYFFGMSQLRGSYVPMWDRVSAANRKVACLYPNDADGNAFRGVLIPLVRQSGYEPVDGGAYPDGTTDYSMMIARFKSTDCQFFSTVPTPQDFHTFWRQAHQQGFRPRLATVGKVLLFPADTASLGPLINNVTITSWWGPYMPYGSTLENRSAAQLAGDYQAATGRQWLQSLGSTYSLFEVAHKAFTAAGDPHDVQAVAHALHQVRFTGMCGPLDFASGPAPGVAIVNPVGVQWKKNTGRYPFEMKVVDNSLNKNVRIEAPLEPTNP
jgi:branched-chain amino acid transport system substrate-binding protein